jgi:hypothetical protein
MLTKIFKTAAVLFKTTAGAGAAAKLFSSAFAAVAGYFHYSDL